MTIIYEYRRTMAGAKQIINEEKDRPKTKRAALTELSLRWQAHARERAMKEAHARQRTVTETELRVKVARDRAAFNILILPPPLPVAIIEQVACWHDVPVRDIIGASRTDRTVEARYDAIVAVALNCRVAGREMSLMEIGRAFHRHHTSILIALRHRGVTTSGYCGWVTHAPDDASSTA